MPLAEGVTAGLQRVGAEIKSLWTAVNGKANASHTHTTSQVTGLDSALGGLVPKNTILWEAADHGLVLNGIADDSAALTNLYTAVNAAGGGVIRITGTCRLAAQVTVRSNVTLKIEHGAEIVKDFSAAGGGYGGALFMQPDPAVKIQNARFEGPGKIRTPSNTMLGDIFALHGDHLWFSGFDIDTYGNRAFMLSGDGIRMWGVRAFNPRSATGCGGIRVIGGDDFKAFGCYIVSGDDSLQFVPGAPGNQNGNLSITNGAYIGCVGISTFARSIAVILADPGSPIGTATMTAAIRNCSFIGCTGGGSQRVLVIANDNSSGPITGIKVDADLEVLSGAAAAQDNFIDGAASGGTSNLTIKLRIRNPVKRAIEFRGPNLTKVIAEIDSDAPSTASTNTIFISNCSDISLRDCRLMAGDVHAINVGSVAVSGFKMVGGVIEGIRNTFAGVRLVNANSAQILGTSFRELPGQTTARAVSVADTAQKAVVQGDFSGITHSTPVVAGTGGTIVLNSLDKNAVGLGNVDNTSDANKPISTAQQTALNGKVNIASGQSALTIWRGTKAAFDAIGTKDNNTLYLVRG